MLTTRQRCRYAVLATSVLAFLASGCRNEQSTAPVSGRVTYKGKPLSRGSVTFVPKSPGPAASGEIAADGRFTLTTYEPGDGAVIGSHTVMITAIQDLTDRLPEQKSPLPDLIIPAKYTNNTTSGLRGEVVKGQNSIDFDLTDTK